MAIDEKAINEQEEDEELALEAPKRETADELLDAGGSNPLDPMRHSAAHVMAEAVIDLFPETKLGIGPPSRTASTTTSTCRGR